MIRDSYDYRIGNLVYDDENIICRIEQLNSQKIGSFCKVISLENKRDVYNSNIYAIQSNEEWLLKFGAKKLKNINSGVDLFCLKIGYQYITIAIHFSNDIVLKVFTNLGGIEISVFYVHQIQNLYFALTGEELTIK